MKTTTCLISALFMLAASKNLVAKSVEGKINPFLGKPELQSQSLFSSDRMPNVVVAMDGSVVAVWNGVVCRRSEDGGATWGKERLVGKGFMGGGVTVDETTGSIFAFVEDGHPPSKLTVYRSDDHAKTWEEHECKIEKDKMGNLPSMHMNDHGITLRHGEHKGRIIRPSRGYVGRNHNSLWPKHYTNAIYSDDQGKTWKTSDPFPANGTGEAAIAELSDGTIYYNSRRHWAPKGVNPKRRWTARSKDGGHTWKDLTICEILPDGDQIRNYGLMGGLTRLPIKDRDVLIFSNIESPSGRHHGTIWASLDGGETWPVKRLVYEKRFAYSSLTSGRPGTKSEGWIYLFYEGGPKGAGTLARFNLSWVLGGESTGDGKIPDWAK